MIELKKIKCKTCKGLGVVNDYRSVGKQLRAERLARGLSLRTVAGQLSFTPAYISDLENGKREWRDELIKRYREAIR